MSNFQSKTINRNRRHARVRSQVIGTQVRPRLSVFRSNRYIYAQVINDETGTTLVSAHDMKDTKGKKLERATRIGTEIAESAKKAGITQVVFDRGGFMYTGRVRAVADAARAAGLDF